MTSEETNILTADGTLTHHENLRLYQFLSMKKILIFSNCAQQRHLAEFEKIYQR